MVLAEAPDDSDALRGEARRAPSNCSNGSGRENFSEVRWLEAEIRDTEAALA